jgi:dihydrofolate reductase
VAKLIYSAIASLDGYIEDEKGTFGWAEPDDEVHAFVNDLERQVGTYLYGRRLYETMVGWETDPSFAEQAAVMRDFAAIWQSAEKIVYSRTLEAVSTARTRIEREFEPDAVLQLKEAAGSDLIVGGAALAAEASGQGWSTNATSFSRPSWWEAANTPSRTVSAWSSSCSRNAASPAACLPSLSRRLQRLVAQQSDAGIKRRRVEESALRRRDRSRAGGVRAHRIPTRKRSPSSSGLQPGDTVRCVAWFDGETS